jgi:hypothetical protein
MPCFSYNVQPVYPTRRANVCGVYNGVVRKRLNFFPNIIHPIDQLPPFAFKVLRIRHAHMVEPERRAGLANVGDGDGPGETEVGQAPTTTGYASPDPEPGKAVPRRGDERCNRQLLSFPPTPQGWMSISLIQRLWLRNRA